MSYFNQAEMYFWLYAIEIPYYNAGGNYHSINISMILSSVTQIVLMSLSDKTQLTLKLPGL